MDVGCGERGMPWQDYTNPDREPHQWTLAVNCIGDALARLYEDPFLTKQFPKFPQATCAFNGGSRNGPRKTRSTKRHERIVGRESAAHPAIYADRDCDRNPY